MQRWTDLQCELFLEAASDIDSPKTIRAAMANERAYERSRVNKKWQETIKSHLTPEWLRKKNEWSLKTFGPGYRVEQLVAHITKELGEVAENPTDPEEWVDIILLALDGAFRNTGAEPEDIIQAIIAKQRVNTKRKWQQVAPGQPTEHVRE